MNNMKKIPIFILIIACILLVSFFVYNNYFHKTENVNYLLKDTFSIIMPQGWEEASPLPGISAMAVNTLEENSEEFENIEFKSYFAVSEHQIQISLEEFVDQTKNELEEAISQIEFIWEGWKDFESNDFYVIEGKITEEGLDFAFIVSFVEKDSDVWLITFNTDYAKWDENEEVFYGILENFRIR